MFHGRHFAIATAVSALLSLESGRCAYANQAIQACQAACESDCDDAGSTPFPNCYEAESGYCYLFDNLTCSSTTTAAIRLRDGTDLDMNGKTLTCQSGVDCHDGVLMEAASSQVFNGGETEGVIQGGFRYGVNCGLQTGTEVRNIRVDDTFVGMQDCKIVEQCVITGIGRTVFGNNFGVRTNGVTDTLDETRYNYIADKAFAVQVIGTDEVELHHNVVHTSAYTSCAFDIGNTSEARIEANSIFGAGNDAIELGVIGIVCERFGTPTGVTIERNLCDQDHPDCADCISAGYCVPFTAPFPGSCP